MNSELKAILDKHPVEWRQWQQGKPLWDLDALYTDLYEHFLSSGEMPYGVAKARTGDPYAWITDRLEDAA